MTAGWQTFERYSLLLSPSIAGADADAERQRNEPVRERLERLIERGQASGHFDARLSPGWLSAVVIGLGHAAGEEVLCRTDHSRGGNLCAHPQHSARHLDERPADDLTRPGDKDERRD